MRAAQAQLRAEDLVAPGWRAAFPYLERFNLRAADLNLLGDMDPDEAIVHFRNSYAETGSVYLRDTFLPRAFHQVPGVNPDIFIYVLENKTLPGREPRDREDAQSRPLVACFFERCPGAEDELIVRRVDRASTGMSPKTVTPAELLLDLGYRRAGRRHSGRLPWRRE